MLAGRNLGFVVGIWTLVATEVGGVFVNGTAEVMYKKGALWAIAPIGYSLRLLQKAFKNSPQHVFLYIDVYIHIHPLK